MRASRWARLLERDEILAQRAYWLKKDIKRPGKGKQQPATKQNPFSRHSRTAEKHYRSALINNLLQRFHKKDPLSDFLAVIMVWFPAEIRSYHADRAMGPAARFFVESLYDGAD